MRAALAGRFARLTARQVPNPPPGQLRNRSRGGRYDKESTQCRLVHSSTAREGHRRAAEPRAPIFAAPSGLAPRGVPAARHPISSETVGTSAQNAARTNLFSSRSRTQVVTRSDGTTSKPNRVLPDRAGRSQLNIAMPVSTLPVSVVSAPCAGERIICNA